MRTFLGVRAGGLCAWRCWPSPSGRLPQACTLLLLVLFIYDVFFVFITPFLTKVGGPALPLLHCLNPQPSPPL